MIIESNEYMSLFLKLRVFATRVNLMFNRLMKKVIIKYNNRDHDFNETYNSYVAIVKLTACLKIKIHITYRLIYC